MNFLRTLSKRKSPFKTMQCVIVNSVLKMVESEIYKPSSITGKHKRYIIFSANTKGSGKIKFLIKKNSREDKVTKVARAFQTA